MRLLHLWDKEISAPLYDLPHYLGELETGGDYVLFGFSGYGFASHALHYYTVSEHLALFFQLSFANVFDDQESQRDRINGVLLSAKLFYEEIDKALIPKGKRLLVVVSDFHPSGWGWLEEGKMEEEHLGAQFLDALNSISNLIKF